MRNFVIGGTLGDAFIAYCKLYDYWKKTDDNIQVFRMNIHQEFDKPLSLFFNNISFIKYSTPCITKFNPTWEKKEADVKLPGDYINIYWDGIGRYGDRDDPAGIKMDPFPNSFITPDQSIEKNKFCVGIQLNSGGHKGNERGISLTWIKNLRGILSVKRYSIYLFGTEPSTDKRKKIETLCLNNQINNFVNKTSFLEWLSIVSRMDYFITFEGLSAYFSMSQKISTFVFFIVPSIILRLPIEWRKQNIIWKINHPMKYKLLRKNPHFSPNTYPINVNFIKNIIEIHNTRT